MPRKNRRRGIKKSENVDGNNDEIYEDKEVEQQDTDKLFAIATSEQFGRYLVTTRDIKPGELLISEHPLILGPKQSSKPVCLGCYHPIQVNHVCCKKCGWPMCDEKCSKSEHHFPECNLFSSKGIVVNVEKISGTNPLYDCIAPLRGLLLKDSDPDRWRTLMSMEAHTEIRKNESVWLYDQEHVVNTIRNTWGMTEFDEADIQTVCGVLEVNAFELGQTGISVRGVFPTAFYMSHDCICNTKHTDDENYRITVHASVPIKRGQAITTTYAYTLQGTMKRRQHLRETKFFECVCKRCSDPTELGTYMSALKCPKCHAGVVLSTNPLDEKSVWKCKNCSNYTINGESIAQLMDKIGREADGIRGGDVVGFEMFLKKYTHILHHNHYHLVGAIYSLSQLYGKTNGYLLNHLPDALLHRKKELCQQMLEIVDVIEPGYSRLRGILLYELHAAMMLLLQKQAETFGLPASERRLRLKEVCSILEQSATILSLEPPSSDEGSIGVAARDALDRLKEAIKSSSGK